MYMYMYYIQRTLVRLYRNVRKVTFLVFRFLSSIRKFHCTSNFMPFFNFFIGGPRVSVSTVAMTTVIGVGGAAATGVPSTTETAAARGGDDFEISFVFG